MPSEQGQRQKAERAAQCHVQISLFDTMGMVAEQPKKREVEETLKKLDISNMTPMEAMNQLYELQKKCK